ncbi:heavy metal transporter [Lutibacter profundi]|uniref:Mercuric transport protein MerT n=1 Tax=Lutibacter profundi TaxID=1622118 RepID=A0A120IDZ9_9FLAO|nr:mercuric transport protein MerTP [Lutibacter profundi]AMC10106.1 heavy metal transporter [Lutibacter profundi]
MKNKNTNNNPKSNSLLGLSLLTALTASLCCITPVLALLAGTSGFAATFSWMEPFRPYLIGITILVLGFAWYQQLKPKKELDCDCETDKKPTFIKSKLFLGLVTVFSIIMLAFPNYSKIFYPENKKNVIVSNEAYIQKINVDIKGMTCSSCEEHVNHTVNELNGVLDIKTSYNNSNTTIEFDKTKTSIEEIEKAINSTGYKVIKTKPIK